MKFSWHGDSPTRGRLSYVVSEYSLDFEVDPTCDLNTKLGNLGRGALLIGTLQLELAIDTGVIRFPWGLFSQSHWIRRALVAPMPVVGQVFLLDAPSALIHGEALNVPDSSEWETSFDESSGWIHVGREGGCDVAVEFATNSILTLYQGSISGVWLKPDFND